MGNDRVCGAAGGETMPKVVSSQSIYQGKIIDVRVDEIELPGDRTATREVVSHAGAVVIAAIDEGERVYLVRQYRHAVGRELVELPAGGLEPDEAPLAAAKRELREEAGLEADEWISLGAFFSSPGFANEKLYAFLARGLKMVEVDPDEDEDLEICRYPVGELLAHLGEITDAKTLATLLLASQYLDKTGQLLG